ncbi:MAG: hypothetical protein OEN02_03780 [Gammaproteobacteria bacterium]|nr:hypothetical protein [Gammaproteobacteria bacterium]MDH3535597.1 hypothetical protein [Gammaproteobacteria bacterium]
MNPVSTICLECRSDIKAGAKKCTECGAYQDWTRYLFRYTSIVTAVLGIIPVITIAFSLYEIAFGEKIADVRAAIVRCESRRLDIGIVNVGEMPAIVSKVDFSSPNTDTALTPETFRLHRADEDAETFLVDPAGTARIVSYKPYIGGTPSRFPRYPDNAKTCKYHVSIETLEFDLNTSTQTLKCDCSRS